MSTDPANRGTRREFLSFTTAGIGAIAMADLLVRDGVARADPVPGGASVPWPHHTPRATRVIHIVLCGGLSQVDSFDYKPMLEKLNGKSLIAGERPDVFFGKVGLLRKNDWAFHQRGESGLWVSDLFPQLATVADELTVIRSMYASSNIAPRGDQMVLRYRNGAANRNKNVGASRRWVMRSTLLLDSRGSQSEQQRTARKCINYASALCNSAMCSRRNPARSPRCSSSTLRNCSFTTS